MLEIPGYRIAGGPERSPEKGVVVTAEARYGGVVSGTRARLFPGSHAIVVKTVTPVGADRYRLTVKGAPARSYYPGAFLMSAEWPVEEGVEALFLDDGGPLPTRPVSIQGGIETRYGAENREGAARLNRQGPYLAAQFRRPFPLIPGAVYTLPPIAGQARPRPLTLLYPGIPRGRDRIRWEESARRRPNPAPPPEEVYGRILFQNGFVALPPVMEPGIWPEAEAAGRWILLPDRWSILKKRIVKAASVPGGADPEAITIEGFPAPLVAAAVGRILENRELLVREGWVFPPGLPPQSPFTRRLLEELAEKGEEGIRLNAIRDPARREAYAALARSRLIRGGDELYFIDEVYRRLSALLLENRPAGTRVTLADAKQILGTSRPPALEVLGQMERDGSLLPDEDGEGRRVP